MPVECSVTLLMFAGLGLLAGLITGPGGAASARVSAVIAARYYSERRERHTPLPWFPRGMFFSVLLSWVPILKGWCRGLLAEHFLFAVGLVGCAVSTGAWLLVASFFQRSVDAVRAARIEEFVSDPLASVPAPVRGMDAPPLWLRIWNWLNVAVFALLMGQIVIPLLISLQQQVS